MDLFLSLHFMVNCILRLQFVQENSFFFHFHGRFGSILPEEKGKHCSFALWKYTFGQKHNFIHVRMYTSEHTCDLLESMEEKKLITKKGKYLCSVDKV